jgi:hypothetical protein
MKRRIPALFFIVLFLVCGCRNNPVAKATPTPPPPYPAFDNNRAFADLSAQCAFGPRVPATTAHEKGLEFIRVNLTKFADSVQTQPFIWNDPDTGRHIPMTNIFGVINPSGSPRIMLSAHWDSRPTADQEVDPLKRRQPIPGADDGASGVAVLLELARGLHDQKPKACVILAFWDGEDWGPGEDNMYVGAAYFAKHMMNLKPDEGVLIDMIGQKALKIPIETNSYEHSPKLVDKVWKTAADLGLSSVFVQSMPYRIDDDHKPLIQAGIPTIDLIDFDYAYWHTLDDTPDKCSPDSLGFVGKVLGAFIYAEGSANNQK